jgi:hypothetical protein
LWISFSYLFTHFFVFRHRGHHIASSSSLDLFKNISLQAQAPIPGQAPE